MAEQYFQHTFPNGLTLLAERMPGVTSAAMTLLVGAGGATDPVDRSGSASVLSDLVLRGAGERDARQLSDYLDRLGLQRSVSVGVHHTRFGCAAVADKVVESLPAYADVIRRPHLPEAGFEAARDSALQALEGIDDDPRQQLLIKLREWFFPTPFGRNEMGQPEHLEKLTLELCKADHARRYHAGGAILAIAGNVEFAELKEKVEACFGSFEGRPADAPQVLPAPGPFHFEQSESEQTHIGIAYPCVEETHADYYAVRVAMEILSGGMSGRLFTELREKRALVYNVSAGYACVGGIGAVLGYAGTSNERAQATLDTFVAELDRFTRGVAASELERAKTGLKASTIMSGESTSARAASLAHDYFVRGRLRTLHEIKASIDAVTLDRVNDYLRDHPPGPYTVVIVGPKELTVPR